MSDTKLDGSKSVDVNSVEIVKKLKEEPESSILSPALEVTQDHQNQLKFCSSLKGLKIEIFFKEIVEVRYTPATPLSLSQLKHDYILTASESQEAEDVVSKQGAFAVCLFNPSCTFDSAKEVSSFRSFLRIYTWSQVYVSKVCIICRHEVACQDINIKDGVVTVREKIFTIAQKIKEAGPKCGIRTFEVNPHKDELIIGLSSEPLYNNLIRHVENPIYIIFLQWLNLNPCQLQLKLQTKLLQI